MEFGLSKNHQRDQKVQERIQLALDWLDARTTDELLNEPIGKKPIADGVELRFQSYDSRPYDDEMPFETHRHHIDIHYMITGQEYCHFGDFDPAIKPRTEYDETEDLQYFDHPSAVLGEVLLTDRHYVIFDPTDIHACHGMVGNKPTHNRKLCVKIALD
ncbi:YhcH/YjgK/YiaL family protein [Limosilactobacillus fermentum]|uniref:Beta-D-galactosidase n=1 Tax=Limosilactobacillus fermentum TaxID=1613 RepID=A0A1L7GV82_LIMFE|nr:YhcH/YjgK/YiaL family protein [Limosilactobacillus fermentum]APU45965.1 beta-D-galactosidase [Limosilactobacillus fermentum]MCL3985503.1 YhcH/YjgK/YiaL family protein [Limosilactobacillus fermentum]MCV3755134.1 YhcH/YjgK/YiaL family protein [Limosilactobacillus fermentum]MDQ2152652.1 YhcH/YjgK/YiaL family protein [Limosilactobacillus fermentum]